MRGDLRLLHPGFVGRPSAAWPRTARSPAMRCTRLRGSEGARCARCCRGSFRADTAMRWRPQRASNPGHGRSPRSGGHDGVILINSDSPTLPASILRAGRRRTLAKDDNVVLSPAFDGGYTLHRPVETAYRGCSRTFPGARRRGVSANARTRPRDRPAGHLMFPGGTMSMTRPRCGCWRTNCRAGCPAFSAIAGATAPATRRFLRERPAAPAAPAI